MLPSPITIMRASGAGFVSSARAGSAAANITVKITVRSAAAHKSTRRPVCTATALVKCDSFITNLRSSRGREQTHTLIAKRRQTVVAPRQDSAREAPATWYEMELNAEEKFAAPAACLVAQCRACYGCISEGRSDTSHFQRRICA